MSREPVPGCWQEENTEKYLNELSVQLAAFEKVLSKNSEGPKFLVGDKISFADYNLLDSLHSSLDLTPDLPGYTLTYFPLRGRAEHIRLLLADQGIPYTEHEVTREDWISGDLKKNAVFGQLPKFQDGDLQIYQSNAILRYLGRKHGVNGSNDKESTLIDMMNEGVEDMKLKYFKFLFVDNEENKEKYLNELSVQLAAFEKVLSKNSEGPKFLVGDKISYADYNLLDSLHSSLDLTPDCLCSFPLLSGFIENIVSRPNISEYLKSDGRKRRPITPKHR
ncbi:glutathione S-transferase P 1-like [Pelodytes ibericus]